MNGLYGGAWFLRALTACLIMIVAVGAWAGTPALPDFCMPSDEIRPGMEGEGRTVFQGFKVETFKAHILGVEHNAMPGTNMILARLEGKFLGQHGVVAGMSGSPVFVDGRLIGAVAYGWSFSYEPYCGITPIEQMWTVWGNIGQPGLTGPPTSDAGAQAGGVWDWQSAWQTYQAQANGTAAPQPATEPIRPKLPELAGVEGGLTPLGTSVMLSGASRRSEERLRNFLACRGISLIGAGTLAGSGAGADADAGKVEIEAAPPIEPGSSLAVPMMTGDLAMAATGTVTWRQGDKLIAFGHPMFFAGPVKAPMAASYIFGFMQSYSRPFKMGEVRETVGTIDQDRQYGIGGIFGPQPARTAMTVQVSGPAASRPRTYHFSCWRDRNYLPMLTSTAFENAYLASASETGQVTVHSHYSVRLTDGRQIEKAFTTSSEEFPLATPGNSLMYDVFMLVNNPYQEGQIESIDVGIDVNPSYHEDRLVSLVSDRDVYKPGETVRMTGAFQSWRKEEHRKTLTVDLPGDLDPGYYVIHVADYEGMDQIEMRNQPGLFRPRNFDDVVRLLQRVGHSEDEMGIYLFAPAVAVDIEGQVLDGLPPSVQSLVQATSTAHQRSASVGRMLSEHIEKVSAPVSGSSSLAIEVTDTMNE